MSLGADYFDRMYAGDPDPWGFTSRWYERRKYALTLAALPCPTWDRALEVGCSVGVFTAELAARCTSLVALDPSAAALSAARARVPESVRLVQGAVPDGWPDGTYDLVVLSESATTSTATTWRGCSTSSSGTWRRAAPSWRAIGGIRSRTTPSPGTRCTPPSSGGPA